MKKFVFSVIIILLSLNSYSQFKRIENKNHNVNKLLKEITRDPDFRNAQFAFLAKDLNSGEIIAKNNPSMALKPASSQKLFSTATALELYGPNYRFETTLQYTGEIDDESGILHGNIVIKGGGDPTLGSKYFDTAGVKKFLIDWTGAIKALGVDSVAGGVIADASIYSTDIVPTTWSWQDIGNYYGAGANGLSIFDNYYTIYFKSGNTAGDTTTISKIVPENIGVSFDNAVVADSISYDNAYIFGAPYTYFRYLRGEIPLNKEAFPVKGSLPDPAYMAAIELEKALQTSGISLRDEATTLRKIHLEKKDISNKRHTIHMLKSPELIEIVTETNVHSINLFAEHCMNHSGLKLGVPTNTYSCSEALEDFWEGKGMDVQGLSLNDGSGLSHYNVITPEQMVYLLDYMKNKSRYFSDFYSSLAVAGKSGTLRNMFKNETSEINLRAKSGTINRVKAYAGYVESASGREIAFSMVVNNFSCSSGEARNKLERLMMALIEFDK